MAQSILIILGSIAVLAGAIVEPWTKLNMTERCAFIGSYSRKRRASRFWQAVVRLDELSLPKLLNAMTQHHRIDRRPLVAFPCNLSAKVYSIGAGLDVLSNNRFKSVGEGTTCYYRMIRDSNYRPPGFQKIASSGFVSTRAATIVAPSLVREEQ